MQSIGVVFGADPPDPSEAEFNKRVAEDVADTLNGIGWSALIVPLYAESRATIQDRVVFNLCDGDLNDRIGLVTFAEEMERSNKSFSGSCSVVLNLGKEKTLAWLDPRLTPRWWDLPPAGVPYIAKPRSAHGSLLISQANVNASTADFSVGEYFFQELLGGYEFTTCFLGEDFLGLAVVRESGIISRDDKWDEAKLNARSPRVWDHSGNSFPQVREIAKSAWRELMKFEREGAASYGRVDVRLDAEGRAYVLDLNPNAYLGRNGNFFSCWVSNGGTFADLLEQITKELKLTIGEKNIVLA